MYRDIATVAILIGLFLTIFGTVVALRWFKHREIMAMVEKGISPEQYTRAPRRRNGWALMGWGVALAMVGLALMAGLWPLGFVRGGGESPYPLNFGPWMLIGLIPLFVGLALLIIYVVMRKVPQAQGVEEGEKAEEAAG
jgi:protein-S-isoprenylcysteine O-methyltransferase Ste14